jgi:hypothetical protein
MSRFDAAISFIAARTLDKQVQIFKFGYQFK